MSGIVESAKKIIEANGLSDKIEIIRGKVEEISLPEGIDKVPSGLLMFSPKIFVNLGPSLTCLTFVGGHHNF